MHDKRDLVKALLEAGKGSDRKIARCAGASQPTITRLRVEVEKLGVINYEVVPDLAWLGYNIVAFATCYCPTDDSKRDLHTDPRVIFAFSTIRGNLFVMVAIKDYDDWLDFKEKHDVDAESSTLVSTRDNPYKQITFKELPTKNLKVVKE